LLKLFLAISTVPLYAQGRGVIVMSILSLGDICRRRRREA
jgi:hypothetical protein